MLYAKEILGLFDQLNDELHKADCHGEVYLVGGAVMCLNYNARPSTKDVDGFFKPKRLVREAAAKVATNANVPTDWLNDAVKGFLSPNGEYESFLELSHLTIQIARPEYLLAMKCRAMRLGEEFHDESDVRFLLRYLNIEKYSIALEVISKYYSLEQFPQKTLYALEELLS